MRDIVDGDSLHRLMKQALDNGTVTSVEDAKRMFLGYKLSVVISEEQASDPIHQMALLTVVALASRVFLGGVCVIGPMEAPMVNGLAFGSSLGEAVCGQGGQITDQADAADPLVVIGGDTLPSRSGFAVRTVINGWCGGVVPVHAQLDLPQTYQMPLAASLSAALAVNEAYLYVNGKMPTAGKRHVGVSLWNPTRAISWEAVDPQEPALQYLPSHLWLIGLGHLGQAFLWNLALLPYANPADTHFVLQDIDEITRSTHSTSILTDLSMVGRRKTRAMADIAEGFGFNVSIMERFFSEDFERQPNEPAIALCGLDNALGRRAMDCVGFDLIVEAGLGRGHQDFRKIRLHTLPGVRSAKEIWSYSLTDTPPAAAAAYDKLVAEGDLDQCGATLMAGKAVGAPFVGMVASCFAISEILRILHGGASQQLLDLDLLCLDQLDAVQSDEPRLNGRFTPQFTTARVI